MVNHNSTKNHFSVVVKKVRAAVLRANYLANGHAQRLFLKLMDSEGRQDAKYQHTMPSTCMVTCTPLFSEKWSDGGFFHMGMARPLLRGLTPPHIIRD